MKKKTLLLGTVSIATLAVVSSVALLVGKGNLVYDISGTGLQTTISFNGSDVMEGVVTDNGANEYSSANVTLKTDQNKNDVVFHHTDTECYEFNDVYYLDFKGNTGSLYNVTEIRSMSSLKAQVNGDFTIEWGWEVDGSGDPIYVGSESFNGGNNDKTCYFNSEYPNYFKITVAEATRRQMTNFVITMKEGCEHGTNPHVVKDKIAYIKYSTYVKCVGFADVWDTLTTVVIPDEIDGLPVTVIGENAFNGRSGITSLTLPSGLISVNDGAFDGCSGITSLVIPKTVQSIGFIAFRGLTSCANLSFEDGGTSTLDFGQACFSSIGHEGVLTLPSRISSFLPSVFQTCTKVTSFALNDDNVSGNIASVVDGVLFSTQWGDKYLEQYPCANTRTEYTIPSDVTRVRRSGGMAYAKNLVTLNIAPGNGGIYFDSYSAANMVKLETVNFGGTGNISFYWYCFSGALLLRDIVVTSNVIVRAAGFAQIAYNTSNPLVVHIPDADIPSSWVSNWDDGEVAKEYIVVDLNYVA